MYEDELPEDITDKEYDDWYRESCVVDGVRIGPMFKENKYGSTSIKKRLKKAKTNKKSQKEER